MASFSEYSRTEARCSYCSVQVPTSPQALMWMLFVAQPQRYSRSGGEEVQSDVSWHGSSSWAEYSSRSSRDLISSGASRSEEHTSELQSPCNLVCRLLLEKKK